VKITAAAVYYGAQSCVLRTRLMPRAVTGMPCHVACGMSAVACRTACMNFGVVALLWQLRSM
jgi:hypothetical protein